MYVANHMSFYLFALYFVKYPLPLGGGSQLTQMASEFVKRLSRVHE